MKQEWLMPASALLQRNSVTPICKCSFKSTEDDANMRHRHAWQSVTLARVVLIRAQGLLGLCHSEPCSAFHTCSAATVLLRMCVYSAKAVMQPYFRPIKPCWNAAGFGTFCSRRYSNRVLVLHGHNQCGQPSRSGRSWYIAAAAEHTVCHSNGPACDSDRRPQNKTLHPHSSPVNPEGRKCSTKINVWFCWRAAAHLDVWLRQIRNKSSVQRGAELVYNNHYA